MSGHAGKQSTTATGPERVRDVACPAPGRRTRTEDLPAPSAAPVQRTSSASADPSTIDSGATPDVAARGPRPALATLFGGHRAAIGAPADDPAAVHAAAARGTSTAATSLPFADPIQRAFGRHDISAIRAHTGGEAAAAARDLGARGYASGDHVVLGDGADLHTAAH